MEMELKRESVRDTVMLCRMNAVAEENGDAVVPDSMPDIIRIVDTNARVELTGREIRGGKVYADATAHISALYVPETGGGLKRLGMALPLAAVFDLEDLLDKAEKPMVSVRVDLLSAAARELNPRKITAKAVCNFICTVYDRHEIDICTGLEGGGVEILTQTEEIRLTDGVYEKTIAVSDSAELPAGTGSVNEILKYELAVRTLDSKQITNKVVIKGEIAVLLLCACDDDENTIKTMETVIPFAGVVDCEGVTEESEIQIAYRIADCALDIVSETGTNRPLLACKANLAVSVSAWSETKITYIADAYSVSHTLELSGEQAAFRRAGRRTDAHAAVRESIASGVTVKNVYICNVEVDNPVYRIAEDAGEVSAEAKISLILEADDGGIYALSKTVPVAAETESAGAYEVERVSVADKSFHIAGDGDVEIRFTAVFALTPTGTVQIRQLGGITRGNEIVRAERLPALTLCYGENGESFWQLGKRLGASVGDILAANGLSGEHPPEGKLLLIPRKKTGEGRA